MRQAPLAQSGFSPPPGISYRGVKLPRVPAALERSYLRRGAELPQVYTRRRLVAAPDFGADQFDGRGEFAQVEAAPEREFRLQS